MKKRILVIDDDDLVLDSVSALLKSKGYEVLTARNAIDALDLLDREIFGLVICDVRLPGISGIEAIQALRNTSAKLGRYNANENVPVIFITAYTEKTLKTEAEKLSPIAYLNKPFDDSILLDFARHVFEQAADEAKLKHGKTKNH